MDARVRTVELHLTVPFAISRATHTTKRVVLVELREGDRVSRGEGVPDAFFGEDAPTLERAIHDALPLLPADPLAVGWDGKGLYLIAEYDTTPVEDALLTEGPGNKQK